MWELWTLRPPLVLPNAPFGTYEQPTILTLAGLILPLPFVAFGAVLAFRRPGLGGAFFLMSVAVTTLYGVAERLFPDPGRPAGSDAVGFVSFQAPPLVVGVLLLSTWWAERNRVACAVRRSGHETEP